MIEEIFAFFVYYICPPLILAIGLICNTSGLVAFANKKLSNVGPCIIYRCLFVSDKIYLVQIIVFYLQYPFFIDPTVISRFSCKLFYYLVYATCLPSPWLLVYISIEKCISIVTPTHRLILKKPLYQYTFIFALYIFSYVFYSYVAVDFDLIQNDNQTLVCNYQSYTGQLIINWMFLIVNTFLPFFTMILINIMLAIFLNIALFQQRANPEIISEKLKKRLERDRIYAKSSFFMNLVFILLNLPLSILLLYPNVLVGNSIYFYFTNYLGFLSYGINFFVILVTNLKFRRSVLKIFRKKKPKKTENIEMTTRQQNPNKRYFDDLILLFMLRFIKKKFYFVEFLDFH